MIVKSESFIEKMIFLDPLIEDFERLFHISFCIFIQCGKNINKNIDIFISIYRHMVVIIIIVNLNEIIEFCDM